MTTIAQNLGIPPPDRLMRRTTCPHCWTVFAPEDVLWVSAHTDLLGDPRLGPEQQQRFLPSRFNVAGNALDACGFACQTLACPRCHLTLPRVLLETEPIFFSILGTPACGKSFFLSAMTWEARRLFAQHFGVAFTDADPAANVFLNGYEESLFLNPRADELTPLAELIRKTELQGALYDTVTYGNQVVSYPRPFLFTLLPQDHQPGDNGRERRDAVPPAGRVLCLYDNAGEHFQPGQDTTGSPVTRHMAQARALLFLFDPLQDPRFQQRCQQRGSRAEISFLRRAGRQESVLLEAAARVRRFLGLPQNARHNRPLIVVLTKADAWADLLGENDPREPWDRIGPLAALDTDTVHRRSQQIHRLLLDVCPELVAAAEGFCEEVVYVPVSALGRSPELLAQRKLPAIRPREIRPMWVTVPLLYGLSRAVPGLFAQLGKPVTGAVSPIRAAKHSER